MTSVQTGGERKKPARRLRGWQESDEGCEVAGGGVCALESELRWAQQR